MHPAGGHPAIEVKTVEPKGRMPIEPLSAFKDEAWVSNDLSEYVVLRDGDVWHGKVDWPDNAAKQERNVTNLGILNNLEPIAWYKNDFYFYNNQGADTPILRIDVKTGELEEMKERTLFIEKQGIIHSRPEHYYKVINYSFLPVADFVDITVQSYITKEKKEFNRRYLVNRTKQKAIELPMEFNKLPHNNANITWIDENRYVFSKKQGSLKDIGTWLYDVRTQTHRKLTPFYSNDQVGAENCCMRSEQKGCWPFPFYFYNQHLVFADKERIVFGVKKGNTSKLVSIPLNGGNIAEIALNAQFQRMRRILPFSIELPLGNH